MRHVTLFIFVAIAGFGARAQATPFEPAIMPEQVEAVGHLDVDALRKTQVFTALGGQKAIDAVIDGAPADLRVLARSLAGTVRGISFWHDTEHGAIYVQTRDGRGLAQLLAKAPAKRAATVDGVTTYTGGKEVDHDNDHHHGHGFFAAVGDTLVLADTADALAQSIRVLGGHAPSLAGSSKLPATSRTGVFVFVTIGSNALNAIQKSAHSKVLQLALKSIVADVSESGGIVTANARAEMGSADAVQKAKSIVDGLRALASLSGEPAQRALLDGVTVTANGLALEVVAKLPVTELAKAIDPTH
ncbi:MAG: hypothetical protein ABIY55_10515 [Kofleriaceae bacterium]